ncbi:MAG: fibrobacter succinogenes major paralogous domain-containing protein, partial [Fibromonadaceae bacterium]|nr:fibrobacter succinogenes major paralogous domain-containing protein [Fibromonadaceae bacterium]
GDKGDKGDAGTSCSLEEPGVGAPERAAWEVFCDGVSKGHLFDGKDGIKGDKGNDGTSCDVVEDGAYLVMKCGGVEKEKWAKALCGATAYDPADQFCVGITLYDKCGGEVYSPRSQVCYNNAVYAAFTDSRDNQKYPIITIGTQTWLAKNLNFAGTNSDLGVCYENDEANCEKYGRLYNWDTAMNDAASSSATPSGVQGVCPAGWHLPSDDEWDVLVKYVDPNWVSHTSNVSGTKLKATSGWSSGTSTNEFGFSALPGGSGSSSGNFNNVGLNGDWWSATELNASSAYYRDMYYDLSYVYRNDYNKSRLFSVRCVQDLP